MSRLQRLIQPRFSALLTSPNLRDLRRRGLEAWRRLGRYPHQVSIWLRADDPYAYLLLQALPGLLAQFPVELTLRTLRGTDADTTPDPERLDALARIDAARLARWHGLDFPDHADAPPPGLLILADSLLLALERQAPEDALETATAVLRAVWWQDADSLRALAAAHLPGTATSADEDRLFSANREAQRELGHYGSAMLHYAGEWYWGLDRIDHLSDRLQALGLGTACQRWSTHLDGHYLVGDPERLSQIRAGAGELDYHFSFRSPYSYLGLARARALAEHYGLAFNLRPVLPMVMRGLPVPGIKRLYILLDAKREADRLGLPFGRVCDPVGAGVERCMAVCHHAGRQAPDFAEAAARAIWADGADMTRDDTLTAVAASAGLKPARVREALDDTGWRRHAEASRQAMAAQGHWGVPVLVLRRNGQVLCSAWGQDRLWVIEDKLNETATG